MNDGRGRSDGPSGSDGPGGSDGLEEPKTYGEFDEPGEQDGDDVRVGDDPAPEYVTADLLSLLLERAREADPDDENVVLDATAAGDLVDAPPALDPTTPVLTHFYFPSAGGSVAAVFGMDLGRPSGRARFLSHPDGDRRLTEADDLAATVLVATPPYEADDVVAYDRRGRRRELVVVDAEPPEERVAE
ncbi:hypothetical protein Hbl1158_06910 [Halobaculum sp. CBA1158]|uniref:hypothetical protein n=1 Tax=Halobaculum sp. CBA1158 TaxID=2904243 RepID=UPI001F1EFC76|nr:hypothetical protein [Halobaculum sp. CBA1158]UIP01076.1 hypothetical protein Hbl1158_06910 [Halobaculum sp. CBA1158]